MLINYIKIAWRNINRQRLFSFINIFGLALSMSIGLIVLVRLKDELSYDKFHPYPDRTYRVISQVTDKAHNVFRMASSPLPLAATLQKDNAFIENTTTIYPAWSGKAIANKKEINVSTVFIQPSFFDVFGFKTENNKHDALANPNTVILSKETANKFFGSADAIGQTIQLGSLGTFLVADVMQQKNNKSHIQYDAYISFNSVAALEKSSALQTQQGLWTPTIAYTYLVLKESASKKQLETALGTLAASLKKQAAAGNSNELSFDIQPLLSISPGEELLNSIGNASTVGKVTAEVMIAMVILIMACFNYTNLSIARALKRAKEVGIRKVAGAFRANIFMQFIAESLLVALLSFCLSYIMFGLMKSYAPFSAELIPADIEIDAQLLVWFLLFSIFTGLLAGIIPAWILSSFKPVQVLKSLANVKLFGRNGFRKALTVIQFSLSLVIIIFMLVFSRQFNYMATADYGFSRERIISLPLQGADYNLLKTKIASISGVEAVAGVSDFPGRSATGIVVVKQKPADEGIRMKYFDADENYIPVLKLKMAAGNNFSAATTGDERYVLVNEKALGILKIASAAEAVGRVVYLDDSTQAQITGVIKDFHFEGFEWPISPMVLRSRAAGFNYLAIKTNVDADNTGSLVGQLQGVWKMVNPRQPFSYDWFDKAFYQNKSAIGTVSILGFLGFIAITIACLGLLGMVIYTTETKMKEVSIRKVMGAEVKHILILLSRNFVKLILISVVIAAPVGWLLGYFFLSIFAVRVSIGFGLVAVASCSMLLLALLVICSQVYRVAFENPVKALRSE